MKRSDLTKNVVVVLALASALGLVMWRRVLPMVIESVDYTDGEKVYRSTRGDGIRYAVWDRPEALGGGVNTAASESRPALSPDGRWLVFTVGEGGLNADLYLAELVQGQPVDPRPIAAVNSPADELAPAFGRGGLYFASNRDGGRGGFDLYRADFDGVGFSTPRPVVGGVNTVDDELDPAPHPASSTSLWGEGLAFASNRPRGGGEGAAAARSDYDLYLALSEDGALPGERAVVPLEAVNSRFDDREPGFTADGRTLFFASDRDPERDDFDLYRSVLELGGWLPPTPVEGLNSELSERGPQPSPDGFALYFHIEGESEGGGDLFKARSLELFRLPSAPLGWLDLAVFAALLLLALLAWLAKRWEQLDIIYKCFLISLLVHLLLMWMFREVYPEGDVRPLGPGNEPAFKVRMLQPRETSLATQERGGALEVARAETPAPPAPERVESESVDVRPVEVSSRSVERARSELAEGPQPTELPVERSHQPEATRSTAVQTPSEAFERLAQNAPSVAVEARPSEVQPTPSQARAPSRATLQSQAPPSQAQPTTSNLALSRRSTKESTGPVRFTPSDARPVEREAPRDPGIELETPRESIARLDADAPRVGEAAPTRFDTERPRSGEPDSASPERTVVEAAPAQDRSPAEPQLGPLTVEKRGPVAEAAPSRYSPDAGATPSAPEDAARALARGPAVEQPREELTRIDGGAESAPEAFEPARFAAERSSSSSSDSSPERLARSESSAAPESSASTPSEPVRFERGRPDGLAGGPGFSPLKPTRTGAARDLPTGPALAQPREDLAAAPGAPESTGAPSLEPALPEPTAFQPSRERAPAGGGDPERFTQRGDTSSSLAPAEDLAPEFRPLELAGRDRDRERPLPGGPAPLDDSLYRSRYGSQKEVALKVHGGDARTEHAVQLGLAYLASRQRRLGYWGDPSELHPKYRQVYIGKTGLSLLAFLGAGHTPISNTEYSDNARRAVEFLLAVQRGEDGHFGNTTSYSHGIATYALAECYAMTKEKRLRRPLQEALDNILRQQVREGSRRLRGGWGYYYTDGSRYDDWPRTSITSWQVMALESGKIGGLKVPESALELARQFLLGSWDADLGAMRYSHDPERINSSYPTLPGSTPAAMFALSIMGEDLRSESYRPMRDFMLERVPDGYRFTSESAFVHRGRGNLYFWYYGSLALLRVGGSPWARWNTALKETLLPAQDSDGSWRPIDVYAEYAGDTDDQRIYTTAICVLTLEVYYRYFTPLLEKR